MTLVAFKRPCRNVNRLLNNRPLQGGRCNFPTEAGLRSVLVGGHVKRVRLTVYEYLFYGLMAFFFFLCSARPGAENVQDTGASFSGWSESNYTLGEADEQVLSMLLAESASYDPLLDNIDWGDDTYSGEMNLNPD